MNVSRLFLNILLILSLLSCQPKNKIQDEKKVKKVNYQGNEYSISQVDSSANILIKSKAFSGVIFSKDYKVYYSFSRWILRDTISDYEFVRFNPNIAEIVEAETILKRCFKIDKVDADSMSMDENRILGLVNYNRQYVGAINKEGERLIWINCFLKSGTSFKDWKLKIVEVDDGGKAFFNVLINLKTDQCYNFFRNSEA